MINPGEARSPRVLVRASSRPAAPGPQQQLALSVVLWRNNRGRVECPTLHEV